LGHLSAKQLLVAAKKDADEAVTTGGTAKDDARRDAGASDLGGHRAGQGHCVSGAARG
jgi:hypothetical protein